MMLLGVRHPGLPCPMVMYRRALAARDSVGWSSNPEIARRREMLDAAGKSYFSAYLERALICPVRFRSRNPSQRCRQCGALDHYERLVPAWVSLRAEGDPDDEREAWCETVNNTATIRCSVCGDDDNFDEILRPDAVLPDWSIGLDGIEVVDRAG